MLSFVGTCYPLRPPLVTDGLLFVTVIVSIVLFVSVQLYALKAHKSLACPFFLNFATTVPLSK